VTETRRIVRVSHAEVASDGEVLVTLGLGSCVAIVLHDPVARVGGLAHVLLPEFRNSEPPENPAKFANTAVPHLVDQMTQAGANPDRLRAHLVGGASMFGVLLSQDRLHTGVRNLNAARAALDAAGIPVEGEEVGREHGRSVYFYPASGRVRVTSHQFDEVEL
jgi:chemotaxis protein CheD